MTKANLKDEITKMVEERYPGDDIVWDGQDEAMFDYYFTTLGKNNELCPENLSVKFSKSGYTTEVSVETWNIISVVDEKSEARIH